MRAVPVDPPGEPAIADGGCRAGSAAVLEPPAFIAGFDDVAVMGQAIQQRRGHLGVPEDGRPFGEGQVGGDDDGGLFVEAADQVEK